MKNHKFLKKASIEQGIHTKYQKTTKMLRFAGILAAILMISCVLAFLPQSAQASTLTTTIPVGEGVAGIAVTPNSQFVYSTNFFDSTVSVISTSSNTEATTITVGQYPMGLAITPDGEYVYVANYNGNSISVISTATNTVYATITGFNHPTNVEVAPDGELVYITNYSGNSVSVISTSNNTVTATITGLNSPGSLAVTPDGEYLYVKNSYGGTSVSVISTGNNTVVETISLGGDYYYYYSFGGSSEIAVAPNGEYVYVTSMDYDGNLVSVISTGNNSVIETIRLDGGYYYFESDGGSGGIAFAPNGECVYITTNGYDGYSVSVISTSNNTVIESVSLGESYDPYGGSGCLALTPNGEYIYAANGGWSYSNSISVISLTPSSTYAITVSQGAHGTISPGTTTVNYGSSQEFTFTPATGYHLTDVLMNGTSVMGDVENNAYTVSDVTGATSLTATFAIDVFTVTVGDHTHGSISSANGTSVNYGNDLSFSVTPDTGYHLVSVLIDGETASAPYNFVSVTAAHTISATFAIDVFTVTVGDHTHGSISSANGTSVNYGNDLSFSVTPDTGYHLVSVLIDGETASAPYNFVSVTAAHTISATFAIDVFTVTVGDHTHGSISSANGTSVNYGNDLSFSVTPDTGYHLVSVLIDGETASAPYNFVSVTAAHTISATFAIDVFTVTVGDHTHGSISSANGTSVNYGNDLSFSVTPDTGYHLVSVLIDGETASAPYNFVSVTAAHTISATFAIDVFTVTVGDHTHGSISSANGTSVNYGNDLSFSVTPDTGYHLVSVLIDGETASAPYNFVSVTAAHTISATFAIDFFTVTVGDHTHGSISSANGTSVNYGNDLSFSVTPDTGYHLVSVLIDGETASAPYNFVSVTAAHTISATFAIDFFTVTVGDHTHGSISSANGTSVNYGNDLSFSVTPDTGYHLVSVLIDGETASAPYNFVSVTAAHTISATFAIDTFTISVTQSGHGTISPGTTTVNYGNDQTFTITPATGYHITSLTVDGSPVTIASSYTFSNVSATHTITASFAIDTFVITVTQSDHGTLAPSTTTVNYGGSQAFTFTPATGYHLVDVLVNGSSVLGSVADGAYTVSTVTGATSLTAEFAINTYAITVSQSDHGTIAPTTTTVNYGGTQEFTITPHMGYHISSLVVDGSAVTVASTFTFSNVQDDHSITASFTTNTLTATVTTTFETYPIEISGNITTEQFSNMTITPYQDTKTTIVEFTLTGPNGTEGFCNLTLPKIAIPFGTNPVVYIDGIVAENQSFTEDFDNFYITYTTHFSTHQIEISFTTESAPSYIPIPITNWAPSQTSNTSPNPTKTPTPTIPPTPTATPIPTANPTSTPTTMLATIGQYIAVAVAMILLGAVILGIVQRRKHSTKAPLK